VIHSVSIGFATAAGEVSKIIRDATESPVSHVYIVFDGDDPLLPDVVFEANKGSFRMGTRALIVRQGAIIVSEIPVDVPIPAAMAWCKRMFGTPYSYSGLFGEAWVQLGRLFRQRWRNPFASPHTMFCSEAATYMLSACGYARVAGLDARSTSPADLFKALAPGWPSAAIAGVQ
jgi:hypothetical protein